MTEKVYAQERRYPRAALPSTLPVAWLGSDLQFFSHVQPIGMGGLFIATPNRAPLGTKPRLTFQVPGGSVLPQAIVRNVAPRKREGCRVHEHGSIRAVFARKLDGTIPALTQKPFATRGRCWGFGRGLRHTPRTRLTFFFEIDSLSSEPRSNDGFTKFEANSRFVENRREGSKIGAGHVRSGTDGNRVRTGHYFPFATIRPRNSFEMGKR